MGQCWSNRWPLTAEKKAEIDTALAMLCFRTGVPFRFVDSDVFRHFVKLLNPEYARELPKSRSVSGVLLNTQYNKTSDKLHDILATSTNLTLFSDGWTNCRGDHIVNFLVECPGKPPIFYESIDINAISEVLEELGPVKFS